MPRVLKSFLKDPADTDLMGLDWTERLAAQRRAAGDIVGMAINVPEGLVKEHELRDGAITWVWVSGGAHGTRYLIAFDLLLSHPSGSGPDITWRRSLQVMVAER